MTMQFVYELMEFINISFSEYQNFFLYNGHIMVFYRISRTHRRAGKYFQE